MRRPRCRRRLWRDQLPNAAGPDPAGQPAPRYDYAANGGGVCSKDSMAGPFRPGRLLHRFRQSRQGGMGGGGRLGPERRLLWRRPDQDRRDQRRPEPDLPRAEKYLNPNDYTTAATWAIARTPVHRPPGQRQPLGWSRERSCLRASARPAQYEQRQHLRQCPQRRFQRSHVRRLGPPH